MNPEMKYLSEKMGRMLLAEEKRVIKKEGWGCTFCYSLEKNGYWEIETPGFYFMGEQGEVSGSYEGGGTRTVYLVKNQSPGGTYELIRCIPGKDSSRCVVPAAVACVRRDSFSALDRLETIEFKNSGIEIEEGAFLFCSRLCSVQLCGSRRYEVCRDDSSPEDRFLYDKASGTILRYLPTEARQKQQLICVYLPADARRIGAGAFSGMRVNIKLYLNPKLTWIGERAFWRCRSIELRNALSDTAVIETEQGVTSTWKELGRRMPKSLIE